MATESVEAQHQEDPGTVEPSDEELWDQAPEDGEEEPQDSEEPVEEEEEVADEDVEEEAEDEDSDEPQHDYEKRYRDLEREFHRRNEDSAQMRQEFQDLRLRLLEQEKELERARTGTQESSKAPNPLDEGSWFSKEDRQTMEEFGELTSTFRKIVQHELAKNSQPQNETVAQAQQRLEQIEQVVQQQNHSQFLRSHESHMATEVGDDYRDIDRDPGFQSFVLASPALTKMMTESVDPVDHASVMNLWLDTTQEGKAYRPDPVPKASPQKKEARRRAASSLVKNSAPQITKNPDDMSLEELWDSIPEGDEK